MAFYLRLSKAFLFSLLLLTCIWLASFSTLGASESQHQSVHSRLLLSRRNLLANEDDFLGEVVPRKKKVIVFDNNDDGDYVAKKKSSEASVEKKKSSTSNKLNEDDEKVQVAEKKKKSSTPPSLSSSSSSKNITNKAIKPKIASSKNETKLVKPKNETKLVKPKNETKLVKPSISASPKDKDKQTKQTSKKVDEDDDSSSRNTKITKIETSKPLTKSSKSDDKTDKEDSKKQKSQNQNQNQKQTPPSWASQSGGIEDEEEEEEDLVSEFRNLPTKFHQTFIPDLHRISTTSKVYLTKYNKQITKGFKPYVGSNYSYTLATVISFVFLIIPLLLLSLVFHRIKTYFSLQKLIIFIQIYLSIYFSILCFSSLITGLESLRFFYLTSQTTYVWLQIVQTLAYVLYLLLLLMYLVLVFTTESDLGQKLLGLAQTFVGFAVGLHYYMTVFHRVVLRQPPRSSWKIHGVYATCFLVICLFAGAERRKKVYLVEGGEEGKTS